MKKIIPGRYQVTCRASISLVAYSSKNIEDYMQHDGEVVKMSSSDASSYVKACLSASESLLKSTKSVNTDINMLTKHLADTNNYLARLNEDKVNSDSDSFKEFHKLCITLRYAIDNYFRLMLPLVKFIRILIKELLKRAQLIASSMDVKA